MVAPEVPTGSLIREAVLDDQSDGQGHDPMGVAGSRRGQVGQVGGKEAAAPGAVMLRVGEPDVVGPPGHRIAQVMRVRVKIRSRGQDLPQRGQGRCS